MTTGILDAKDLVFYLKEGTNLIAFACATNASLSFSMKTRETICKETGDWETYKPGLLSVSGSFSGLFSYDATNTSFEDLYDKLAGKQEATVRFSTEATGDTYWEFKALITELTVDSGQNGENVTYSGSLQGVGPVTKATVV
ncbi:MAG: hypothetical protein KatS3mg031_2992 [Chitinophagales bacterium]|nr:MAG: hypothetical protein KatS3mg031_2992 [Chitinophagales bacterium]